MELRPCSEPGHYVRSSMGFPLQSDGSDTAFEFQIILTEAEVQALKVRPQDPLLISSPPREREREREGERERRSLSVL
jgi:hypothetical protein